MTQHPFVSAILLSAGESTRMGRLKALLPWRGATLIQSQVASLLAGGADEVIAVLGFQAASLRPLVDAIPNARVVVNRRYPTGKSSSVRAGLRRLRPETTAIVVLSVDQPRSPGLVRRVLAAHRESGAPITYPAYQGKGGHPIVFSANLLPEMLRVREATEGLRQVVERHRAAVNKVELGDPEALLDLNRPEDYEQALAAAATKGGG